MEYVYYGICFYYEKMKINNIIKHLDIFNNIDNNNFNKEFIITVMTNNTTNYEIIENEISCIIQKHTNSKFKVIVSYNWGGTILGLWLSYNYVKNFKNAFFVFFEEDFIPFNNNWLIDSMNKLDNILIYIGESTIGKLKLKNDDRRITNPVYKDSVRLADIEVWTDGGYYFTTIKKLQLIEAKIGIFHKGNPFTQYNRLLDGIDYGEVGFPSLLNQNGFKFDCLNRDDYFIHG